MIPADMTLALANHLWQSTAVAAAAALLAVALRGNPARIRYWLWMVASAKFLIPFSLLTVVGGHIRSTAAAHLAPPAVSAVVEKVAQPFSPVTFPAGFATQAGEAASAVSNVHSQHEAWIAVVLIGIWIAGFSGIVFSWWRRWRKMRQTVRAASRMALVADVPVLSSRARFEPGIFGIFAPVLVLPDGILERLTPAQLKSVLTHEMCHVRRRDNLTAAFHMIVEAVFWFHPIVWWIGARLAEERERACDEAVLQSGNEASVYAEGILNVCKLYFESPLICVSGVTGSDLKKRIVRIATQQVARKLDFSRKLLLSAAGVLAIAGPIVFGLVHASKVQAQGAAQNAAQDITGTWQGVLHAQKDLRTVLKVSKKDGGGWKAEMYSLDQGGRPIPVTSISLQGSTVKYYILMVDGTYEGKLSPDGSNITGNWTQGPKPLPLNLARVTPETAWAIPEPPPRPKPMAADYKPVFEVATIKPSKPDTPGKMFGVRPHHFSTLNTTVREIMTFSFGIHPRQIVGAPPWVASDKYDLDGEPDGEGQPNDQQWKSMIQKLLADRLKLTYHHEQKELSVYALVVAKGGPKLTKSEGDPNGLPGMFFRGLGVLPSVNANMGDLAHLMQSAVLDRPVIDKTGLQGRFDFMLKWTPDESQFPDFGMKPPPPSNAADAPPSLFTAMQEQLGLRLEPTKAPVDVLVIDHIEKPSEN